MAKPMAIPETVAGPANPSEPSFVTTLPAEIRLAIYEILFKSEKMIMLHNVDAYFPIYPGNQRLDDDTTPSTRNTTYDDNVAECLQNARHFTSGLGDRLPLLLSCRQIYHECVKVLYGSNMFIITRAQDRHDKKDPELQYYSDIGWNDNYNQIIYAPIWLSAIGSQINHLRHVLIDIGPMCPLHCPFSRPIDLTPLLRLIWLHPELASKIGFGPARGPLKPHSEDFDPGDFDPPAYHEARVLNAMLDNIGTKDILGLKKYTHFGRLSKSMSISFSRPRLRGDKLKLLVDFQGAGLTQEYVIHDEGKIINLIPEEPEPLEERCLPPDVLCQVCKYVAPTSSEIVLDVDNRKVRGLDSSFLGLTNTFLDRYSFWEALVIPVKLR
ncbi:hypothetical protein OPT61_g4569 [Boeremia exigua]|uniref:Uncharacterized protein n=1 Tax=Boeremia exigua TaxID=749465 RepID=A0ACC2IDU2_9PLEO|nr:hypothetical protein OPT61_g4569 [Boeremia exigua]